MFATLSPTSAARFWALAFVAATVGVGLLTATGVVSGRPAALLFVASMLLLWPMLRSAERAAEARGCMSAAMRRYNRRVFAGSLVYLVLLWIGVTLVKHFDPATFIRVLFAVAVAAPVLGIIWAMALLLREETDEYLRSRFITQSLIATGFMLTVATIYGFLNTFDVAPRLDAWAVFPLWAIGLAIGRLVQKGGAPC